jgi:hypothetical protein
VATASTYRAEELSQHVMWLLHFVQSAAGQVHVKMEHRVVSIFTLDRAVNDKKVE